MHDVEVVCDNYMNDEDENEDGYNVHDEEAQDEHEEELSEFEREGELMDAVTSISRIKIGRIEIFNNKNSGKDDPV